MLRSIGDGELACKRDTVANGTKTNFQAAAPSAGCHTVDSQCLLACPRTLGGHIYVAQGSPDSLVESNSQVSLRCHWPAARATLQSAPTRQMSLRATATRECPGCE
jgi:hypothetical protein